MKSSEEPAGLGRGSGLLRAQTPRGARGQALRGTQPRLCRSALRGGLRASERSVRPQTPRGGGPAPTVFSAALAGSTSVQGFSENEMRSQKALQADDPRGGNPAGHRRRTTRPFRSCRVLACWASPSARARWRLPGRRAGAAAALRGVGVGGGRGSGAEVQRHCSEITSAPRTGPIASTCRRCPSGSSRVKLSPRCHGVGSPASEPRAGNRLHRSPTGSDRCDLVHGMPWFKFLSGIQYCYINILLIKPIMAVEKYVLLLVKNSFYIKEEAWFKNFKVSLTFSPVVHVRGNRRGLAGLATRLVFL